MPGFSYGPDVSFQSEQGAIDQRRKLAEALQAQGMKGIQSARPDAPVSWTQGLAQMLNAYAGKKKMGEVEQQSKALAQRTEERRGADTALLAQALQGRQAQPGGLTEDASGNATQSDPLAAQTPVQSLGQAIPMMGAGMQPFALQALQGAQTRQDQQAFQSAQAEEARQGRAAEFSMRSSEQEAAQRRQQEFVNSQARAAAADRAGLFRLQQDAQNARKMVPVIGADGKAEYVPENEARGRQPWNPKLGGNLPASAIKEQNEILDAIGTASNIKSDLGALSGQIATGELPIGPMSNKWNAIRNTVGQSSTESNNYNTFVTTLERLRNDSLRLNKGVQTDTDAQRAWNELMGNLNDPAVVQKRLGEIQSINERAVNLHKLKLDQMRRNFGAEPVDTVPFENQKPVIANPNPGSDRRGSQRNGKTVVVNY